MKKFNRRDNKFIEVYSGYAVILAFIAGFLLFCFMVASYNTERLNDTAKISAITKMASEYEDDYTKALNLDNVIVEKDEDITVTIETTNYKHVTTYDISGNLVEKKLTVKIPGIDLFCVFIFCILDGYGAYLILMIPGNIIKNILTKKDDIREMEFYKKESAESKNEDEV